ncbi:MAG TPA: VanW family protein [Gaiellaceae bacterium]|nr:VanW family protein [Gaiellaceae bacterium]
MRVQRGVVLFVLLAVTGSVLGLAFAGSPGRIADGVSIEGVDVGGMTPGAAERLLEQRAKRLERVPVVFVAGDRRWRVTPTELGVTADWHGAVEVARRHSGGFGPLRGFKRIGVRVFGADFAPPTRVYNAALQFELNRFSRALYRPHRNAVLRLHGLEPVVVPGTVGRALDRGAAARIVVAALAGFSREPVALPVRRERAAISTAELATAAARVRVALSAPVEMRWGPSAWAITPWQLRSMLALPGRERLKLQIGGPGANRYFANLRRALDRPARNAGFAVTPGGSVGIVPARRGRALNAPSTAAGLLAAALSRDNRTVHVVVGTINPGRTTRQARSLGIHGLVGSYETIYGGDANRIHNVQLVARLLDGKLIAPGATFSFNRATGARTAAKGFREAPVIINGELQTGLGGGVCQVSTTVFNAAYEAGLKITARTNHALYISHYPLGRDATVDYPDVDLRFINDTPHWLLLRTFVGSFSLTVGLYGAPQHRRVVTDTRPLVETGQPPVDNQPDPSLTQGRTVVVDGGEPSRSTSVRRRVYMHGKLLYDDTWYSSYRAEPKVVEVGTKPKPLPEPKKKKKKKPPPPPTTTATTTTTVTTTTPSTG